MGKKGITGLIVLTLLVGAGFFLNLLPLSNLLADVIIIIRSAGMLA
ncbi:hypothetical protein [Calorimonas adulescens]|nr:hypothetical protein [Calorimonas adulescens]